MVTKTVGAGAFKQGCLALLDEVAEGTTEVVVTKRGRPVARVVAIVDDEHREAAVLARMRSRVRGSIGRPADLVAPTLDLAGWKLAPPRRRRGA